MTADVALVTGVGGQDGWYLADLLLRQGYKVIGSSFGRLGETRSLNPAVEVIELDIRDATASQEAIERTKPTEIYNLAALSSSAGSFADPTAVIATNGVAVAQLLEAIRVIDPTIRLFQASTSELFGDPIESPQSEGTPFRPRTPYGAAKLYAHAMVDIYRKRYGLFASCGILFNHEGPRRDREFVSRRISEGVAKISLGLASHLELGNIDSKRDWGFSGDYMRGAWLCLQAADPQDFVFATGHIHSVRDFCRHAFEHVGLDYRSFVRTNPSLYRPSESLDLIGDASKARRELDWAPEVGFKELVRSMVDADLARLASPAAGARSAT